MIAILSRIRSTAGDSIVETLVSILIITLSIAVLTSAVVATAGINQKVRHRDGDSTAQRALAESHAADAEYPETAGTVTLTGSQSFSVGVNFMGGPDIASYENFSGLRQAVANCNGWMLDHQSEYGTKKWGDVDQAACRQLPELYELTPDEISRFRGEYHVWQKNPTDPGDSGPYYAMPSYLYIDGTPVNLVFICATPSTYPHPRPIGFIYNGECYGMVNPNGMLYGSMYIAGSGTPLCDVLNHISQKEMLLEDLFTQQSNAGFRYIQSTGGSY